MKTIEDIEAEIELNQKQIKELYESNSELDKKKREIIFKEKLYITDLSEFNKKTLSKIFALDSKGEEVFLPLDEIVNIEDNRLYCSSFNYGIVSFNEDKKKYQKSYYGAVKDIDIIGFYNIEVDEEWSEE